jgi:cytochrome c oxidase assembly protein subunit 11
MEISPGKVYSTYYIAKNNSTESIKGQAVPSVSPNEAARYLKKIECFCFEQQTFKPGEEVRLPLYFVIDEKLPNRIKTLTLSYSFFESVDVSKKD